METITREEAFQLLKKYNKDPFHIQHALTVEAVMKWYARKNIRAKVSLQDVPVKSSSVARSSLAGIWRNC